MLQRASPPGLPGLPRRFLWVFLGFVVAAVAYIMVVGLGPDDTTLVGERIQAIAQKGMVLAALATLFLPSLQARWIASGRPGASHV